MKTISQQIKKAAGALQTIAPAAFFYRFDNPRLRKKCLDYAKSDVYQSDY